MSESNRPSTSEFEWIREAYAAGQEGGEANREVERVAEALQGDLSAEEAGVLLDRSLSDPALEQAWVAGGALQSFAGGTDEAVNRQRRSRPAPWLGLAATLTLIGLGGWWFLDRLEPESTARNGAVESIRPQTETVLCVPGDCSLAWEAAAAGARYRVEVADPDLNVIHTSRSLDEARYVLPARLVAEHRGTILFWRVDGWLPDGREIRSATYRIDVR